MLRYIFSIFIDEIIKRDEAYRKEFNEKIKKGVQRANAPTSIQMPSTAQGAWAEGTASTSTPRANGNSYPMTPGMGIGVATPAPLNHLPGVPEDGTALDKRASQTSRGSGDYFSSAQIASDSTTKPAVTPGETQDDKPPKSPSDTDKENNGGKDTTLFGKKFRMGMSFGSKKLGRSPSTNTEKPVVVDEKVEEGSETSENGEKEEEVDDNLFGVIQTIRHDYDKSLLENPDRPVESGITPSLPNETPVLKHPPLTTVIIQEETSGGSADLYRGTVATVGDDASLIEQRAPMWVGDLLLRVSLEFDFLSPKFLTKSQNKIPFKEPVKVSFILLPWQAMLPGVQGVDGNSRLNANRMLRVKKILAYVADAIENPVENPDPNALRPEDYLELFCYDQVGLVCFSGYFQSLTSKQKLPITMSLATLRAHVWKGGADVMLYYKTNGRKELDLKDETFRPLVAEGSPPLPQAISV